MKCCFWSVCVCVLPLPSPASPPEWFGVWYGGWGHRLHCVITLCLSLFVRFQAKNSVMPHLLLWDYRISIWRFMSLRFSPEFRNRFWQWRFRMIMTKWVRRSDLSAVYSTKRQSKIDWGKLFEMVPKIPNSVSEKSGSETTHVFALSTSVKSPMQRARCWRCSSTMLAGVYV
jgi:hypothetical protein